MALPTDPGDFYDVLKWIGGFAVSAFGFFLTRTLNQVEATVKDKADGAHMLREIQRIEAQLQESREARERDIERLERANNEKIAEFAETMRDRLNSLERNLDQRLTLILQAVSNERRGPQP